jgi:hypothetical protein
MKTKNGVDLGCTIENGLERLKMRFCIFKLKILMYLLFVCFNFVLLRKVSFKQIKTIMGILSDYWEEQMEESNRRHYGEEAYLLIKKCQAEVLEWKEIARNKDNEIKRLQSIIDSQRQSHAWEIAELEKKNAALRNVKHN